MAKLGDDDMIHVMTSKELTLCVCVCVCEMTHSVCARMRVDNNLKAIG